MQDKNLEIVPGERIGLYYLSWDFDTLKKHLPENYVVRDCSHVWGIVFNEFSINVRKIDNRIDSIAVNKNFNQHFKQITSNSTLGQVEDEVGPTESMSVITLTNYPGIEFYFGDEDEDSESEDAWRNAKIETIAICDPNFIWDEHFSHKDYEDMRNNKFGCPFPPEKIYKWDGLKWVKNR